MPQRTIEVTELAEAIAKRLDEPDMNVRKAADTVGVSHQTIQNWADGRRVNWYAHPTAQTGLAELLGVSPREILAMAGFNLSDEDSGAWLNSLLTSAA